MAETSLLYDMPSNKSNPTAPIRATLTQQELDCALCLALGPLEAFADILLKLSEQGGISDVNAGSIGEVVAALQGHAYNCVLGEFKKQAVIGCPC